MVDLSHNNFGVMLMTPQTVEVGLTLTNANDVIHLSRWWNPAVENLRENYYHASNRDPNPDNRYL